MIKRLLILFFVIASGTLFPVAAQDDPPSLLSVQSLEDILGDDFSPSVLRTVRLSPGGAMMAWWANPMELCIYAFLLNLTICNPTPEAFVGANSSLVWSPDSSQIAFTAEVLRYFVEGDIWVFNIADQTFINRTEDNNEADLFDDIEAVRMMDYSPVWHPITNELYFLRTDRDSTLERPWTLDLFRLPADGEAELVQNLTDSIPGFSVYTQPEYAFLDGTMTFSPDGTKLALMVRLPEADDPRNGIWIIDIEGQTPPEHVHDFYITGGLPEFQPTRPWIMSIAWSADSSGLIISGVDPLYPSNNISYNYYYFDLASREVTPFTDFTGIKNLSDLFRPSGDLENPPLYYMPRAAVILGGDTLVALSYFNGASAVSFAQLPPDGIGLTNYTPIPDFEPYQQLTSSASSDGKVLLGGYLFHFDIE